MTPIERFKEIMEEDYKFDRERRGCPVFLGLLIISNYIGEKRLIEAAEHDIVYSVDLQELLDAGIRESDIEQLRNLGWHVDSDCDCLAKFV